MAHPTERRRLLKLMAASLALAGCDPAQPGTEWVPAVAAPPGIVPGVPNHYATATLCGGAALGVVVTHQMGRPIKVEGNPLHPASLGATDALAQAEILDLYDPDRSSGILHGGYPASGDNLLAALHSGPRPPGRHPRRRAAPPDRAPACPPASAPPSTACCSATPKHAGTNPTSSPATRSAPAPSAPTAPRSSWSRAPPPPT